MYNLITVCKSAIRKTSKISNVSERMNAINKCLEGYGVEVINGEAYHSNYWGNIVAEYVNMGDTYTATVLYDVNKGKFIATTYGDWIEKNQNKYNIQ